MVESDISERDKYLNNEIQKYLIKSQIYGNYYCSKLLKNNLPGDIKETLSKIYATLLKDKLIESDFNRAFDLINDISISNLSFENRILVSQLSQSLTIPVEDEFIYYNEIENIIDPYLDLKMKIYNYSKKSKYLEALKLVNQILENIELGNYDNFIILGIKVKIIAEMQDFEFANKIVDLALDNYEWLSEQKRIELQLQNEVWDEYKLNNQQMDGFDEFQLIRISTLYIIKSFNAKENGHITNILPLLAEIIPLYSHSNCKVSYADLINEKATIEFEIGNIKDALNDYITSFGIYLKTSDQQRKEAIFNNISRIFIDLEDWNNAIKFIEKGLQLTENDNFNESLIISKCILLYKSHRLIESLDHLKKFIFNDKLYISTNLNTLYNLNMGLILFLVLNVENGNFNSLDIFKERINTLLNNELTIRSKWKDLNHFIFDIMKSSSRNENLLKNLGNLKDQLKIPNKLIILSELI